MITACSIKPEPNYMYLCLCRKYIRFLKLAEQLPCGVGFTYAHNIVNYP